MRDEGGFTLPEVLVAMTLMVVVLFALYAIFDMSIKVFGFGNDKVEAEAQLSSSLATLFNVTEDYPDIAASAHFRELQKELVRLEDKLNAARSFYNLSVEEMNATRRTFPSNLVGWIARIEKLSLIHI